MGLGKKLRGLTKSELDTMRIELNLTDDELIVFNELIKGRTMVEISNRCMISTSTVSNRVKNINNKYIKVLKENKLKW